MKLTKKILLTASIFIFFTLTMVAQDFNFIVSDAVDLRNDAGYEEFTKLINTLNQLNDIDFVLFNKVSANLSYEDDRTKRIIRKLKHPVYFLPDNEIFWQQKTAREKFYNSFGETNFYRSKDSLGILGINSAVSWSPEPFFERESFNFIDSRDFSKQKAIILALNNSPVEIKNFDDIVLHLDSTKIHFILAPLISDRLIYEDRIILVNSKNDSRRGESFKKIAVTGDTLSVSTHKIDGTKVQDTEIIVTSKPFNEIDKKKKHDPDKLAIWEFDLGYSLAADILVNGNQIYAADVSGQVVCLNSSGKKVWEYYSFGYIYSTPTIQDNYLAIATIQGDLETINVKNGKAIQSLGFDSPITTDLTSFDFSGPVNLMIPKQTNSKGAVIIGTASGKVYCYDLETLQEHWRFESAGDKIIGKPVIVKNNVIFYSLDGYLYSLNSSTGLLTWKIRLANQNEEEVFASDPVFNNDDVFISLANGNLFSVDILLGRQNWEYSKYDLTTSLEISNDGRLLFAKSDDDRFHILSANTGTWVKEIYTKLGKHKSESDILQLNEKIYFSDNSGSLILINENYLVEKIFQIGSVPIHSIKELLENKIVLADYHGKISLIKVNE